MTKQIDIVGTTLEPLLALRLSDLIVRTAHVRRKDALRVLKALEVVSTEYQLDLVEILHIPMDASRPNPEQKRQCETAYLWLYENDDHCKPLFEIEQLV